MRRSVESRSVRHVTLGLSLFVIVAFSATPALSQWRIRTVDTVAGYSSLAFDPADGNPSVAYSVYADRIWFAHWNGSSWDRSIVADGFGHLTLVYTEQGPTLAFQNYGNDTVNYAYQNASGWVVETVDGHTIPSDVGLAYDASGEPAITYRSRARGPRRNFNLLRRVNGSWAVEVIDGDADARYNSLAFDAADNPVVAYWDDDDGVDELKYAVKNGSSWTYEVVAPGGIFTNMKLDPDGNPAIVHRDLEGNLQLELRNGSSWDHETVAVGYSYCTLAFDSAGTAFIGMAQINDDEIWESAVAERLGANSYFIETVDLGGGYRVPVALSAADNPAIVYGRSGDELYAERLEPCSVPADCDDGDLCTTEVCNAGSCEYTSLDCDDGDLCTGDVCNGGVCENPLLDCDDGDLCTIDYCDLLTGCVTDPTCPDDGDPCTTDCDPATGNCGSWPIPGCDDCGGPGASCTDNADCCSNKCKGKPGSKTCS